MNRTVEERYKEIFESILQGRSVALAFASIREAKQAQQMVLRIRKRMGEKEPRYRAVKTAVRGTELHLHTAASADTLSLQLQAAL